MQYEDRSAERVGLGLHELSYMGGHKKGKMLTIQRYPPPSKCLSPALLSHVLVLHIRFHFLLGEIYHEREREKARIFMAPQVGRGLCIIALTSLIHLSIARPGNKSSMIILVWDGKTMCWFIFHSSIYY